MKTAESLGLREHCVQHHNSIAETKMSRQRKRRRARKHSHRIAYTNEAVQRNKKLPNLLRNQRGRIGAIVPTLVVYLIKKAIEGYFD